ncbi:MAG: 50S ribosomal protein L15 [Candidatus Shapirobacteria bacterium]|nr:50S ribosomal protein L15 [Candidatus Shapirobacteria bacterium]
MKLNQLPKSITRNKKRLGRGYGSGKGGHTSSRGAKGDNARGKVALIFEGTKMKKSFLKRLPLRRGKGKFKPQHNKPLIINLDQLNILSKESLVNIETLVKVGLVVEKEAKIYGVKILGNGELKIALKVALPCSGSAKKKIEKAGGKIIEKLAPAIKETQVLPKNKKNLKKKV